MNKHISLFLVCLIGCSLLTGCGGNAEVPASTSIASSNTVSEQPADKPASSSSSDKSSSVTSSSSTSSNSTSEVVSSSESSSDSSSSENSVPASSSVPESDSTSMIEQPSIQVGWDENSIRCKEVVTDSDKRVYVEGQGYTWGYHHFYLDIVYQITNTGNCIASLDNSNFSVIWDGEPLNSCFIYINASTVERINLLPGEKVAVALRYPISPKKYEEFYDQFLLEPHKIDLCVAFEESKFSYTYLTKLYSQS